MNIRNIAYSKYQLHWMLDHGYSIMDLVVALRQRQTEDPEDFDQLSYPIDCLFEEWEEDSGFNGELWVCFDEFCEEEYEDAEYMRTLLTDEEFAEYLKDRCITHKAVNIQWDTDDEDYEDDEELDLPKEIYIPEDIDLKDDDEVSDYLSDLTGFCHFGYELVKC